MLLDAATVNATSTLLALMVGGMLASHWKVHGRSVAVFHWMLGALALAVADSIFLIRTQLGGDTTTVLATGLVSAALLLTLRGVGLQCGVGLRVSRLGVVLAGHVTACVCLAMLGAPVAARMAVNSLVWGCISLATVRMLLDAGSDAGRLRVLPVKVFGFHAGFHALRLVAVAVLAIGWPGQGVAAVQSTSLAEASLFTVAAFAGLLIADLQQRHRAISAALAEVKTLSGLLPICSCCKKIREESGHWARLETYVSARTSAQFSHGICPDCARDLYPELHRAAARPARAVVRLAHAEKAEAKLR